jgi:hypothetical protein
VNSRTCWSGISSAPQHHRPGFHAHSITQGAPGPANRSSPQSLHSPTPRHRLVGILWRRAVTSYDLSACLDGLTVKAVIAVLTAGVDWYDPYWAAREWAVCLLVARHPHETRTPVTAASAAAAVGHLEVVVSFGEDERRTAQHIAETLQQMARSGHLDVYLGSGSMDGWLQNGTLPTLLRSPLVSPGRSPASVSARRTHRRGVSWCRPSWPAMASIAFHYDG